MHRHAFTYLGSDDQEVSRVAEENQVWRADVGRKKTAKNDLDQEKIAEMEEKEALAKAKYAPRKPQRGM